MPARRENRHELRCRLREGHVASYSRDSCAHSLLLVREEWKSFRMLHQAKSVYTNDSIATMQFMDTISSKISTRELRNQLSEVLGRTMYGGERIGVTRNGKLAAVVVSIADLEALEAFEMAQDVAAYRDAKAQDDGGRVSLDELRRDLSA